MLNQISQLRISEEVRIETGSLQLLQTSLGDQASQDVIERAIVEVAERIGMMEKALLIWDCDGVAKTGRGLSAISDQLGLVALSQVAQDAVRCAGRRDSIALHAVVGRLARVGDASLSAAIEGAIPPA